MPTPSSATATPTCNVEPVIAWIWIGTPTANMPRENTDSMRAQKIARKCALLLSKLKSRKKEGLAIVSCISCFSTGRDARPPARLRYTNPYCRVSSWCNSGPSVSSEAGDRMSACSQRW